MWIEKLSPLYTDYYELVMAQAYFLAGRWRKRAVFDLFFRSHPFGGGYVVFAGIGEALPLLLGMRFGRDDLDYLEGRGFDPGFLEYLRGFAFRGQVYACREGEVVFAGEPVVRVEGNLIEAQLAESLLLNFVNFESLVATKAARMVIAARGKAVVDFGLRRAQGTGAMQASRAARIGGMAGTSNVLAAAVYGMPAVGTQAHSWIQSYESEIDAFRDFAERTPGETVLLVDTYDTLGSGVPNAIRIARELERKGRKLAGIRLDSGDLASLARRARAMLDEAGFGEVKIIASNRLDEHAIEALEAQGAPIDAYGVGTRVITGAPDAALDGVYKLADLDGEPRFKISEEPEKANLPGRKGLRRHSGREGEFRFDGICLEGEEPAFFLERLKGEERIEAQGLVAEDLLCLAASSGELTAGLGDLDRAAAYCRERLGKLPERYRRLDGAASYKVALGPRLAGLARAVSSRRTGDARSAQ